MALTTRFFSTSNTPFVPNGNKMDPGLASAAARAAEAGAGHVAQAMQGLAATIDMKAKEEEKPDDLYIANAKANVEVDYNKSFMEASGQLKPNGSFGTDSLKMLNDMSQPYLQDAPNDATRKVLAKSFMGLGKSAQMRGDTLQFSFNERHDLSGMADYATKSAALLTMGQVGEEKAYANLEEQAAALTMKGYDREKIDRILKGSKDQVYLQSRLTDAAKDPFTVLKNAAEGTYADKGVEVQKHIVSAAQNNIKGQVGQLKTKADDTLNQIYSGKPAGDEVSLQLDQMKSMVAQTQDPELTKKYSELALAQRWDAQTINLSIPELHNELFNISKASATGSVTPEQAKKFEGVIKNRIDWATKDGFAFYQLQNPTALVGDLPKPGDPQEVIMQKIQSRSAAAASASELQGRTVAPVTAPELQAVFQNFKDLPLKKQEQQLQAFAAFGADYTPAIAELAGSVIGDMKDKSAASLVPALNLMQINPAAAMDILKGTEKLNNKVVSIDLGSEKAQTLLNDAFGSLYLDDPQKRSQYYEAAKAITANKLAADPNTDVASAIGESLKELSGIRDVEQTTAWYKNSPNYKIIPPEYGMSDEAVQKTLDSITPDYLKTYSNGAPMIEDYKGNRIPLDPDTLSNFQYSHVRGGKYKLVSDGANVINESGESLLFDMRSYFRDNKSTLSK